MADNKPGFLRNLRVKRVSLVDFGANYDKKTGDGAHIMLYKRADVNKDGPSLSSTHVDVPIASKKKKKENDVKKSLFKSLLGLIPQTDANKAQVEEISKAVDGLDDDVDKAAAHDTNNDMCKCADCMSKRAQKNFDATAVVDAAVSKAMTDVEKKHNEEIKKLNDQIEVEKNLRLDREMLDILKSFKFVPVDLKTDVVKFRKMKEAHPEEYARTIELLAAADAQLSSSQLFKSFGSDLGGNSGDAWKQIENKADALVQKDGKLTREQAIEKVMLDPENKALVAQYRSAQ